MRRSFLEKSIRDASLKAPMPPGPPLSGDHLRPTNRSLSQTKETEQLPPIDETHPQGSQHLSSLAEEIYLMRRARDREMPSELFGEPAWDMLLALYRENDPALTINALHLVSGIPESTAVRWVAALPRLQAADRPRLLGAELNCKTMLAKSVFASGWF
jgi:hypothetical protein